jgi:hypothetical protein
VRSSPDQGAKLLNITMKETHALAGCLLIEAYDSSGLRVLQRRHPNLITNQGRILVAQLFSGVVQGISAKAIAIGVGTKDADASNTQLGQKVDQANASLLDGGASGQAGPQTSSLTLTAHFDPLPQAGASSQAITEAGILLTPQGNNAPILYNRVVFAPITRTAQLSLDLSWEVSFA